MSNIDKSAKDLMAGFPDAEPDLKKVTGLVKALQEIQDIADETGPKNGPTVRMGNIAHAALVAYRHSSK